jgi:hypothetical protein
MSLILDSWKNSHEEINKKTVNQLLGMCGDGKLKDGKPTSIEFREFLSKVSSSHLKKYSLECLSDGIDTKVKGLVLQDLVNEIGSRIGFNVIPGRYRGSSNIETIGFDGLWNTTSNKSLIVEIKTSSTYSINLNTVGDYKKHLIEQGKCVEDKTSILLVVGGFETESWESQIRGSVRNWDTRIVSVEGLIRLLEIKEDIDETEVFDKISNILTPQEYTKVDGIIDIVFSTTEDLAVEDSEKLNEEDKEEDEVDGKEKDTKNKPSHFYQQCIERIESELDCNLIKDSRTSYKDNEKNLSIVCLVSRAYGESSAGFWFSFHTHQKEKLLKVENGYLCLGCGSENSILIIPVKDIVQWLDKLGTTERKGRFYHHLRIKISNDKFVIITTKEYENISIHEYLI